MLSLAIPTCPIPHVAGWDDVDSLEHLFISDLLSAMLNGHYKLLGQQEWEGALCEHFSVGTLVSLACKSGSMSQLRHSLLLWKARY